MPKSGLPASFHISLKAHAFACSRPERAPSFASSQAERSKSCLQSAIPLFSKRYKQRNVQAQEVQRNGLSPNRRSRHTHLSSSSWVGNLQREHEEVYVPHLYIESAPASGLRRVRNFWTQRGRVMDSEVSACILQERMPETTRNETANCIAMRSCLHRSARLFTKDVYLLCDGSGTRTK